MGADGLVVEKVSKRWGALEVLQAVSLEAEEGKITALIGENGAGKSTLFKILMGLVRADQGRAFLAGQEILSLSLSEKRRAGLGYLPQESASFAELTVEENLRALLEILPLSRRAQEERLEKLLHLFGLTGIKAQKFRVLSRGEQRRLELAKALAGRPRFLLLDEPFSGLDPRIVEEIAALLRHLAESGIGVLLTDHNIHITLRFVDHVYLLSHGVMICSGRPEEMAASAEARRWYLGEQFQL